MTDPNLPPQQPGQGGAQQPGQPPQQPQQPPQGQYQQPPQGQYQQPPQYQQPAPGQQPPQGQYQQQYQQPQAAPAGPLTPEQDKQWAMFAHFGGVLYLLPSLIIWLVFKDRGQRTNVEAKEALNWQITFLIGTIALWIVFGIISAIMAAIALGTLASWPLAIAGLFYWLPGILWVLNVVFSIMGGVKVNGGGSYRYPVNFRFIK